jgi:hypothetical protein
MGWTTQGVVVGFLTGARGLRLIETFQAGSSTHTASYSESFGVSGSRIVLCLLKVIILGPTQPVLHWIQVFLLWSKAVGGHNVNHLTPSSVKVKNEWSYTSAYPVCLYGMGRDNFTFNCVSQSKSVTWCGPVSTLCQYVFQLHLNLAASILWTLEHFYEVFFF